MGRKRTHQDSARTKIVSARLKPETYDLISDHARKLGLSRAGYIEHLIENRPLKLVGRMSDELPTPLINELKRIGNNLNQIAHARNAGLPTDHGQYRTVLSEIITIMCRNEALKKRYDEASAEVSNARTPEIEPARSARPAAPPPVHSATPPRGYAPERQRPQPPRAPMPNNPAAPRPSQLPVKTKPNDPKAASPRSKFPWSLFVRSTRR